MFLLSIPVALLWLMLLRHAVAVGSGVVVHAVERQERPAASRTLAAMVCRETVARTVFHLAEPLARALRPAPPSARCERPVLLVSPPPWSAAPMLLLARFLTKRGHTVFPISLSPEDTLAQHAETLEIALRVLRRHTECTEVDVVAHGRAGLAVAWLLRHHTDASALPPVRRFVALAVPFYGTRFAALLPEPADREVTIRNHHLDALDQLPVELHAIVCPDDPVVIPHTAALPQGASHALIDAAGHLALLLSARTLRTVAEALKDTPT